MSTACELRWHRAPLRRGTSPLPLATVRATTAVARALSTFSDHGTGHVEVTSGERRKHGLQFTPDRAGAAYALQLLAAGGTAFA